MVLLKGGAEQKDNKESSHWHFLQQLQLYKCAKIILSIVFNEMPFIVSDGSWCGAGEGDYVVV